MAGSEVGRSLPLGVRLGVCGEGDGEGRERGVAGIAHVNLEWDAISGAEVGAFGQQAEELCVWEGGGGGRGEEGEGERGEEADEERSGHRGVVGSTPGFVSPVTHGVATRVCRRHARVATGMSLLRGPVVAVGAKGGISLQWVEQVL